MFLFQTLPPVRSKIKRISQDQKSKCDTENHRPARISGYDYVSWDKFDVVSFILHYKWLPLLLPVKQVLLDTNDDARLIFCYMKMPSIKVVGIYKICVILVLYVYKGYWFKGNMWILKKRAAPTCATIMLSSWCVLYLQHIAYMRPDQSI